MRPGVFVWAAKTVAVARALGWHRAHTCSYPTAPDAPWQLGFGKLFHVSHRSSLDASLSGGSSDLQI